MRVRFATDIEDRQLDDSNLRRGRAPTVAGLEVDGW